MWFFKKKAVDDGRPKISFKAAGSGNQSQANLILARNQEAFPMVGELFADVLSKRCDMVLLDYSREAVTVRYQVDGIWHDLGQRDRPTGDAMLAVMKKLADLDMNERKKHQEGKFKVLIDGAAVECVLISEGVKTGERVQLKMGAQGKKLETLDELGMREQMIEQLKSIINHPEGGMLLVASRPGDGLTTTWTAALRAADRYMRNFVAVEPDSNRTPEVDNVSYSTFDSAEQTPDIVLKKVFLQLPEAVVVPEPMNAKTIEMLCNQSLNEHTFVMCSIHAKDAAEAVLRILALKPPADKFAKTLKAVLFQRLVRRLCETCKQEYQPSPDLIKKLGIPTDRRVKLYRQWQPPPPEQNVDKRGRPLEPEICPDCHGVGYRGRVAVYELLTVSDKMREGLVKRANLEMLRKIARATKHRTIQQEGIAAVVRGITAINELQRILKQ